jgi:hypothetical protein
MILNNTLIKSQVGAGGDFEVGGTSTLEGYLFRKEISKVQAKPQCVR